MAGCSPPDAIANAATASKQRSSRRRPTVCCDQIYASLYKFPDHTNLGAASALQNKRKPLELNFVLGAYRFASEAANTGRWNGEIPVENRDESRDPALLTAFRNECLATDLTSNSRNPLSLRAPNGVLKDSFYQATGRPLWNAAHSSHGTLGRDAGPLVLFDHLR